jgi:hypothetical protein
MTQSEQAADPTPTASELAQSADLARKRTNELTRRAESISVLNPFSLVAIRRFDLQRKAMKDQYADGMDSAIRISEAPLSGGAISRLA